METRGIGNLVWRFVETEESVDRVSLSFRSFSFVPRVKQVYCDAALCCRETVFQAVDVEAGFLDVLGRSPCLDE